MNSATARNTVLVAVIAAAGVILAGGVFFGAWAIDNVFSRAFGFEAGYVPPDWPQVAATSQTAQFFSTIVIESHDPLVAPRVLTAIAMAIPYLTVIVGAGGTIALARRLMTSRPFAGAARILLFALAVCCAAQAIAVPWLRTIAAATAIRDLGMPTDGTQVPSPDADPWVTSPAFDIQDVDWPFLVIAAALVLVGILWRHAAILQRDTEGLV
ncbi:hypothetical protein [Microbacterium karelineae]|uniref:hypothetical protein n=1 Tax=Microbacterium karelineae TaxID=2654283 RepID=UPI0012EAAE5B|nr:hypothetical protein [Microbacterium karelineae]